MVGEVIRRGCVRAGVAICAIALWQPAAYTQQRLKTMPRYAQYVALQKELPGSVALGSLPVTWRDGGKSFDYSLDDRTYHYDIAARRATEIQSASPEPPSPPRRRRRFSGGGPGRGRQFSETESPDGKWKAIYRDRNLWLAPAAGGPETAITTDGSEKTRVKYATASWVYGEELEQRTAMWWSPDSRKLAFYRFDESKVKDYFTPLKQLEMQDALEVEPFPLAGAPNPIVDLFVYDLATKRITPIDVRDGKPFSDTVVGHYVYGIDWSADGKELLLHRTNRRQNVMEYVAADPQTGKCRQVFREEWPASWTENSPPIQFLQDGKRFLLTSERTGFRNLYLYDLSGKLLATITHHPYEVDTVVRIDEAAGVVYYTARSGDDPLKLQLHRIGLNGEGDRRLTDPAYNHDVDVAPDGRHFIDVAQTHDSPPVTRLLDASGAVVATLARTDLTKFQALHLRAPELFKFKAADGSTDLYGMLQVPPDFDPARKYPLLVTVYAGPDTPGAYESFGPPSAITALGFCVASLDARSAPWRGKRFTDAIYEKLGQMEIDDLASGVKYLRQRSYIDGSRVGIFGTSYGGYASTMCLLRYPDVFQAASASSPVTDWREYDSIYTERYMWLPQENKTGYDASSAMTYAQNLTGRLLLYYGTSDDNVHPSHTLQLIDALQRAGKSFEVQVGPDQGHSGVGFERMLEFFVQNLIVDPPKPAVQAARSR